MTKQMRKLKCLSALDLKLLAMTLMLCDHLWATIVPGAMWLTNLGRMAFPIFAFQIAEGWTHTSDRKKYRRRMLLWALATEIPFNLMYGGGIIYPFHQNVLFTFWLALLCLAFVEWAGKRGRAAYWLAAALACVLGYYLGLLTMVDYFGYGVVTVLLFYLVRDLPLRPLWQLAGLAFINLGLMKGMTFPVTLLGHTVDFPQQALALLALIPVWLYNGEQGPHNKTIRRACYAFYPVHMLILAVLWLYVLN